jgi:hypothetical protein
MNRQYTQQELQQVLEAENILRSRGLIVDDQDGKDFASHNAERITSYFELNTNIPLTVQAVLEACELMKDQMHWKSAPQMEYETLYNALSQENQQKFGAWWFNQKNVLVLQGDEGYENASKVISWMTGRTFDPRTLDLAVSNLAASGGLHLVYQSTFKPGRHSGGDRSFMSKSDTNLSARDHAARRAAESAAAAGRPAPTAGPDYRALAEAITTGRTHSDSARIQRMYVMKPGTSDVDWEQTYAKRRNIADGKGR